MENNIANRILILNSNKELCLPLKEFVREEKDNIKNSFRLKNLSFKKLLNYKEIVGNIFDNQELLK